MRGSPKTGPGAPQRRDAEEIGAILARWLAAKRVKERVRPESVFGSWTEIVGAELAAATRPVRLAAGVLTVEVSSAALLTELATYRREEVLAAVRAHPDMQNVQELRLRAGTKDGASGKRSS